MKRAGTCRTVFIFFMISWSITAAAGAKCLRMVYIEAPPFYYTDQDGRPQGFLYTLAKQVSEKAGYELYAVSYPAKRMAQKLINGEADLWLGATSIPLFKDNTVIGSEEIFQVRLNIYYRDEKEALSKTEDFSGKSLIVMRGYSYGGLINYIKAPENKVTYYETDSHESAFKMLKSGRADYLLDYATPAQRILKTLLIPNLKSARFSSVSLKFVVSKKVDNAADLLNQLEDAYRSLLASGDIHLD